MTDRYQDLIIFLCDELGLGIDLNIRMPAWLIRDLAAHYWIHGDADIELRDIDVEIRDIELMLIHENGIREEGVQLTLPLK